MLLQLLSAYLYSNAGDGLAHRRRLGERRFFRGARCAGTGFHMAGKLVTGQFSWNNRCRWLLHSIRGHLSGNPLAVPLPV